MFFLIYKEVLRIQRKINYKWWRSKQWLSLSEINWNRSIIWERSLLQVWTKAFSTSLEMISLFQDSPHQPRMKEWYRQITQLLTESCPFSFFLSCFHSLLLQQDFCYCESTILLHTCLSKIILLWYLLCISCKEVDDLVSNNITHWLWWCMVYG